MQRIENLRRLNSIQEALEKMHASLVEELKRAKEMSSACNVQSDISRFQLAENSYEQKKTFEEFVDQLKTKSDHFKQLVDAAEKLNDGIKQWNVSGAQTITVYIFSVFFQLESQSAEPNGASYPRSREPRPIATAEQLPALLFREPGAPIIALSLFLLHILLFSRPCSHIQTEFYSPRTTWFASKNEQITFLNKFYITRRVCFPLKCLWFFQKVPKFYRYWQFSRCGRPVPERKCVKGMEKEEKHLNAVKRALGNGKKYLQMRKWVVPNGHKCGKWTPEEEGITR